MKWLFNRNAFLGTVTVFALMFGISQIGVSLDFLNVFDDVFNEFDLLDVYYSVPKDANQKALKGYDEIPPDSNVVLVNIGKEGRAAIAEQIRILSAFKPKVIGLDTKFRRLKSETVEGFIADSLLEAALKANPNIVLGSWLESHYNEETKTWDSLTRSHPKFSSLVHSGFMNTISDNEGLDYYETWRFVSPKEKLSNGTYEPAFAVKIVELYDKKLADEFLARNNEQERINYKGNIIFSGNAVKYTALDVYDVLEKKFDSTLITGKIVLIGYLGETIADTHFDEDKKNTPLNFKQLGRSVPDMYGVVVHANIVSMLLEKNYIDEMDDWLGIVLSVILCYINVAMFIKISNSKRWGLWFNLISKLIVLTESVVLLFMILYVFANYQYVLETQYMFLVILLSSDLTEIYLDVFVPASHRIFKS